MSIAAYSLHVVPNHRAIGRRDGVFVDLRQRVAHELEPAIMGSYVDGVGRVAHAQARVTAIL